jgi:ATP-dependent RNA helicase DDX35
LIVSSATLDATTFLNYFSTPESLAGKEEPDVKIVSLEGRMYPVEIAYLRDPVPDYVRKTAEVVMGIHNHVSFRFLESGWRVSETET